MIGGDGVRVRKGRPVDLAFAHSVEGTLSEWASALADQLVIRKAGDLAHHDQQSVAISVQRLLRWVPVATRLG